MSDSVKIAIEAALMNAFKYVPKNVKPKQTSDNDTELKLDKPRSNASPWTIIAKATERHKNKLPRNKYYDEFILGTDHSFYISTYIENVFEERWPEFEVKMENCLKEEQSLTKDFSLGTFLLPQETYGPGRAIDDYIKKVLKEGDTWLEFEKLSNLRQTVSKFSEATILWQVFPNMNEPPKNLVVYCEVTGRMVEEFNRYFEFALKHLLKPLSSEEDLEKLTQGDQNECMPLVAKNNLDSVNRWLYHNKLKLLGSMKHFKRKDVKFFEEESLNMLRTYKKDEIGPDSFSWRIGSTAFDWLFRYFYNDKNADWPELEKVLMANLNNTWIFLETIWFESSCLKDIDKKVMPIMTSVFAEAAIDKMFDMLIMAETRFAIRDGRGSGRNSWYDNVGKLAAAYVRYSGKRLERLEQLVIEFEFKGIAEDYCEAIKQAKRQGHVIN